MGLVSNSVHLRDFLADAKNYEHCIEALHQKVKLTRPKVYFSQSGVSLESFFSKKRKVAELLSTTVSSGEYEPHPVKERVQRKNDKVRVFHKYEISDFIVSSVIASGLSQANPALFPPSLYSYVKEQSWWTALKDFCDYIRTYRRSHPNPKDRMLFVARKDIEKYTQSIVTEEGSLLWIQFSNLIGEEGSILNLVKTLLTPQIQDEDTGTLRALDAGIATGSPLSNFSANLHLLKLDEAASTLDGFYARYGDDTLFCTSSREVFDQYDSLFQKQLEFLSLTENIDKSKNYCFSASGSSTDTTVFSGTTQIEFLGCRVLADGTIALRPREFRSVSRVFGRLLRRLAYFQRREPKDTQAEKLCRAVTQLLNSPPPSYDQVFSMLQLCVTDRGQLKQLDYEIALTIAEAITGAKGKPAFAQLPYRRLRQTFDLPSLVQLRNISK